MPTRTALVTAVALVPVIRLAVDAIDAAFELAGRVGVQSGSTTVGAWELGAQFSPTSFGLGFVVDHEQGRGPCWPERTEAFAFLGPLSVTATREHDVEHDQAGRIVRTAA